MTSAEEYLKCIEQNVSEMRDRKGRVLLFGASKASWHIIKVLEHYNVPIYGIIENDKNRFGDYYGYPVDSLEEMARKFPDSTVLLGLFRPTTAEIVKAQLKEHGFIDIRYIMEAILFTYFIKVAGRKCDAGKFAKSIKILFEHYTEGPEKFGFTKNNFFISPPVVIAITQRCSLRCRDCGQLIPYYQYPENFKIDDILYDIHRYAQAFDIIPEITLHGGEPFVHPAFHLICEKISSISNIVFTMFTTNGTILPAEDKILGLATCGAYIHQSDYGKLSRKQNELFDLCKKSNVYCDIHFVKENHMWSPLPKFIKQNRKIEKNNDIYQRCVNSQICCQIMQGELHRCPVSMHGSHQGLIPHMKKDYIDLRNKEMSDPSLKTEIREFIMRKSAIGACDFCSSSGNGPIPPAIQLGKTEYDALKQKIMNQCERETLEQII